MNQFFDKMATAIRNKRETNFIYQDEIKFTFKRSTDKTTFSAQFLSCLLILRGGRKSPTKDSLTIFVINKDFSRLERAKKSLVSVAIYTRHFMEHGRASSELWMHARTTDLYREDLLATF